LIALLLLMLPANVHAARARLMIAGRRASSLVWACRQMFWISLVVGRLGHHQQPV
jgi:hypothetical protein